MPWKPSSTATFLANTHASSSLIGFPCCSQCWASLFNDGVIKNARAAQPPAVVRNNLSRTPHRLSGGHSGDAVLLRMVGEHLCANALHLAGHEHGLVHDVPESRVELARREGCGDPAVAPTLLVLVLPQQQQRARHVVSSHHAHHRPSHALAQQNVRPRGLSAGTRRRDVALVCAARTRQTRASTCRLRDPRPGEWARPANPTSTATLVSPCHAAY